jgi:hypothetical protein
MSDTIERVKARTLMRIGTGAFTIATAVDAAALANGFTFWPTLPKIGFSVGALVALLLFWSWRYAHQLRMAAKPKFMLSFIPNEIGMARAIDRHQLKNDVGTVIHTAQFQAVYIRILADAISGTAITDCRAFITELKKMDISGTFIPVGLPQPVALHDPFTIYPKIQRLIDFAHADEANNKLSVTNWPLILNNTFNDKTTYRFKIAVYGGGSTEAVWADIMWNGRWDTVTGAAVTGEG